MLRTMMIAAALAAGFAGATAASAQDYRAQGYSHQENSGAYNDGGLGRYCPPGYYPHSFPGGSGIRCEAQDGRLIYNPPF